MLENINSPSDLKKLSLLELQQLANEVRNEIIEVCSANGGHVAPNLGSVELTIALHYALNAPNDKIVWDVGHQVYTHKILTGRKENFKTIRTYKGLSGFTNPEESCYDTFIAGHASTSISIAEGIAISRKVEGKDFQIAAVIGDGALTGGMAFEALNHVGYLKPEKFMIIINDNHQSYGPTVGGLAAYTSRLEISNRIYDSPIYHEVRTDIHYLMDRSKGDEKSMEVLKRLRERALHILSAGMVFEELGFEYLGPVDGHNIGLLIESFEKAKKSKLPVIVHVNTIKGKGYAKSENDEIGVWHGIGPFNPETGFLLKKSANPTWSEVFGKKMEELGKNKKIIAVTAAMPLSTGLKGFEELYPERLIDVGMAEQHAVTISAGMASQGLKPIVVLYSTFFQRGFDQLIHDVCITNQPVIFCLDRSGLVEDGPTHHGILDIAMTRPMPGMVLMSPKCDSELNSMLDLALTLKQPVVIRYPRGEASVCASSKIELGKAEIIKQEGFDAVIIAYGQIANIAVQACEELKKQGIKTTIVNARFAKPLDEKLFKELSNKTKNIITLEEGVIEGGFGSAVTELLEGKTVTRLGIPDRFIEHGNPKILYENLGLDVKGIVKTVSELIKKHE
jgi:1-deoxy-D-xylulose-5-phosphate synthase